MRLLLYNILVNRHIGIRQRYHRCHDGAVGIGKVISRIIFFFADSWGARKRLKYMKQSECQHTAVSLPCM